MPFRQDGILVEWEELLPLQQFAIRVPMYMLHRLDEILREFVKEGLVPNMQKVSKSRSLSRRG